MLFPQGHTVDFSLCICCWGSKIPTTWTASITQNDDLTTSLLNGWHKWEDTPIVWQVHKAFLRSTATTILCNFIDRHKWISTLYHLRTENWSVINHNTHHKHLGTLPGMCLKLHWTGFCEPLGSITASHSSPTDMSCVRGERYDSLLLPLMAIVLW